MTTKLRIALYIAVIVALLVGTAGPAAAQTPPAASPLGGRTAAARLDAADLALTWLAGAQKADGGFGDGASDWHATVLTVQAFLARGEDAATLVSGAGNSPADYLIANAGAVGGDAYKIASMILAGVALGQEPAAFAGHNWPAELGATLGGDGRYAGGFADAITTQCTAIAALRAAYQPAPAAALAWLKGAVHADGGWGPAVAGGSDSLHTGLALQALLLAGEPGSSPVAANAVTYLRARRTTDAGFAAAAGSAQMQLLATAAAVRGLVAAGQPLLEPAWMVDSWTAFDALLAAQEADGAFRAPASGQPEIAATVAGVQALLARGGPARQRQVAVGQALSWLHTQQLADGSFGHGNTSTNAVTAIAKGGQDPAAPAWTPAGTSALAALAALMPTYIGLPDPPDKSRPREAEAAKAALAAVAAGANPRAFGGYDLVGRINFYYDAATGRYHPTHLFRDGLAIMGLAAAGAPVPDLARQTLLGQQTPAGGWGWASATTPDMDTTGRTLEALIAAGQSPAGSEFERAAAFIASWQYPDGSLPDRSIATVGNSNSTALAIAGLRAAGRDPRDAPFAVVAPTGAMNSLLDALLSFQEDSGAYLFTRTLAESRLMAVLDAAPALSGSYPAFEPAAALAATTAGTARFWRQDGRVLLIAPYAGDGNHDGTLLAQSRASGGAWLPLAVTKTAAAYLMAFDGSLAALRGVEVRLEFQDADGVEGNGTQTLAVALVSLPMVRKM